MGKNRSYSWEFKLHMVQLLVTNPNQHFVLAPSDNGSSRFLIVVANSIFTLGIL
jgi:hypothetical protein